MSTCELAWKKVSLSDTLYYASPDKDPSAYALQWHTSASTLFIMFPDQPEIDVRLDREISEIQYQHPAAYENATFLENIHQPEGDLGTAYICLTMLPSRPLPWAKETWFDPTSEDNNGICIQLLIDTDVRERSYKQLVSWMKRNVNGGEALPLDLEKSGRLWDKNRSKFWAPIEISESDDQQDDQQATDNKDVNDPVLLKTTYGHLTKSDIAKLQPARAGVVDYQLDRWANDNLISFGLKYATIKIRKQYPYRKFHIVRTNFYQNLVDHGPEKLSEIKSKVNIFELEFLIIPVHLRSHWFLVIIDSPGGPTNASIRSGGDDLSAPGFYILDSLKHGHPEDVFEKMHDFIQAYSRENNVPVDSLKFGRYNVSVPLQKGLNDCGFYLLHFAEQFMGDPKRCRKIILSQSQTKLTENWGDPSKKRAEFHQLVEELHNPP